MSELVNVSPDTRFDEATPDQFRKFWEGQGWVMSSVGAVRSISWRNVASSMWLEVKYRFQVKWT